MTNKEAIQHLRELKTLRIEFPNTLQEKALDMAIKVLDIYKPLCPVEFPTEEDPYPVCSYTIPQGEWIEIRTSCDIGHKFYYCSKCNRQIDLIGGESLEDYPFCHCGAAMRKGGEK